MINYDKIFSEITGECRDVRTHIILGILQSIRDKCLIDDTTLDNMLKLVYNQKKGCLKDYTLDSTKIDTINENLFEYRKN